MKKKSNKIKYSIVFALCLMLAVMGVFSVGIPRSVVYADGKETNETKEEKQITMSCETTVGNYIRPDEKAEVVTTVTNNGEDFNGYVQIFMRKSAGENVMYQSDLVLAAGETKNISTEVRMTTCMNRLMVYVKDADENVINKQKLKVKKLSNEQCLVGILTDNKQNLGYWDKNKVVYLDKEDITSVGGMSVLDVLVINDFNTGDWEKGQYETLKEWVEQGGNLIIGTGEQVNRTLAMFQDDYLVGKIGEVKKGETDISFEEETNFEFSDEGFVLHKVNKGVGEICIINKDLGLDKAEWTKKGYAYVNDISSLYTKNLQDRLKVDSDVYYDDYSAGHLLRDSSQVPDVGMLTVILFIYIIIISVVIYVVLKKKDKQSWTWGAIPLAALIFAGVIIGVGARTRINGAGLYYLKIMEFQEEGNSGVKNTMNLSAVSSNNSDYELAVPEGIEVYAKDDPYYVEDFDDAGEDFQFYDIGFHTVDGRNMVMLKNNTTFNSVDLKAESVETVDGSYKSDIHYVDGELLGTFTNNTNFTIKNAIYYGEQYMYQLGTIKAGETVEITEKTLNIPYSFDVDTQFYKIAGLNKNQKKWSLLEARYVGALEQSVYQMCINEADRHFVCGYIEDVGDEELEKEWGMDCFGITLVQCPVSVDYTTKDGCVYVPDILKDTVIKEGYYDDGDHTMDKEELVLDYVLESGENLKELLFVAVHNPSIDKSVSIASYAQPYQGKIELYNWKTKKFDSVFEAKKEGKVTDLESYVDNGNTVRVRIKPQNTSEDSIYIPVISAKKEVNRNG